MNRLGLVLVCLGAGVIAGIVWKGKNMSKLHDDLLAQAKEVKSTAEKAAAIGTEQQQQMADVFTLLQEATKLLQAFIDDNAAQGSSTGGGSGAKTASQQGWKP